MPPLLPQNFPATDMGGYVDVVAPILRMLCNLRDMNRLSGILGKCQSCGSDCVAGAKRYN